MRSLQKVICGRGRKRGWSEIIGLWKEKELVFSFSFFLCCSVLCVPEKEDHFMFVY